MLGFKSLNALNCNLVRNNRNKKVTKLIKHRWQNHLLSTGLFALFEYRSLKKIKQLTLPIVHKRKSRVMSEVWNAFCKLVLRQV